MKNPYEVFDEYGIRHLLTHLIQAEAWEGLGQTFSDAHFVEVKCTAEMSYELVVDYNEAILRTPNALRLLENIWNGLSGNHTELLQQLLHRFLYVATTPDQSVLKRVPKDHEIEIFSRVRLPQTIHWPPMIQFLNRHQHEVIEHAPNQIAIIAEKWLVQDRSQSYQKEAAELGFAVAWRVFYRNDRYTWYTQQHVNPKIAYRAVLASVGELPEQTIEFIRVACGRQKAPPPPPEFVEPATPQAERDPNLPTPPLGSCYPEVEIPPWPDGPIWTIDRHFRDVCLNESEHLVLLIARYPEIARELILALLIKGPGKRQEDWQTNEFYCDYELQDKHGWFPPFYNEGPFLLFLSLHAQTGLDLILRLVNFVTKQWKERRKVQSQDIPFVRIPFPDGEQQWFGERRMYTTYRDSTLFQDVIVCALMALEQWFYSNLDKENSITEAIDTILKHTQSLAFAGLLIGIGKKHPALFKRQLKPFLAVPEFYSWEMRHQFDGESHHMMGWDLRRYTENQIAQARDWHNMPHRKLELSTVALHLFLNDEDIRKFIENVREQWQSRFQKSTPDAPLYDRLAKLIREFDSKNWKLEEHPKDGKMWRFYPPEDFVERLEKEYPQFLDHQRLLFFPFQCRERLNKNQPLEVGQLDDFWNTLQRIEQFTDEELEDFYQLLQQRKESNDPEDTGIGKRLVQDSLCGGTAVLIQFHRDWLREHPEKETWCLRTLTETILSPPSLSPLDNEVSVYDMNWDNFCAYALPILWAEDPQSELWRRLIVRLVTHPHYITAKILFLQAVTYRQQLGDDFFRLQHLILQWAWARWHFYYPMAGENGRKRQARIRKVSKTFDKIVKKFMRGSLAINPPSWEILAAERYKRPRPTSKKHYVPRTPGLDIALIRHAFAGLPPLAEVRDHGERERILVFWQEALNCVLSMLGHGDEEIEEIDGTPGDFEGWVFDNIVQVILQLHPSENQQKFWKSVLDLGTPAHYWIESFLLRWFFDGLASNQYQQEVFIQVWKEMLDFAFTSSKWGYDPQKCNHQLDDLWYRLMGVDGNFLHLWNEQKIVVVNEMREYYERWASLHLFRGYNTSAFMAFLQTPAAKDICLDGILWLEQAASQMTRAFRYEEPDRLAGLLTFYWQNHQIVLRRHSRYWAAFESLLDRLVRQGNNKALALSERISSKPTTR